MRNAFVFCLKKPDIFFRKSCVDFNFISLIHYYVNIHIEKIVSEYDQEIPQSQTADNPLAPRGRAAQPSRDTMKTNYAKQPVLSSPSRWLQY